MPVKVSLSPPSVAIVPAGKLEQKSAQVQSAEHQQAYEEENEISSVFSLMSDSVSYSPSVSKSINDFLELSKTVSTFSGASSGAAAVPATVGVVQPPPLPSLRCAKADLEKFYAMWPSVSAAIQVDVVSLPSCSSHSAFIELISRIRSVFLSAVAFSSSSSYSSSAAPEPVSCGEDFVVSMLLVEWAAVLGRSGFLSLSSIPFG